ncbi:hypothetical protein ACIPRL_07950 [Streptomyces sp. NPDC090085]|uniref:hypothetical protein n=1 Tax=Streptomyces sp. NPDC090085 TaxID=3365943 RepID=UPI00381EB85C
MTRTALHWTARLIGWTLTLVGKLLTLAGKGCGWIARKAERPACRCGCPGSAPVAPTVVAPARPAYRPNGVSTPVTTHEGIRAAQHRAWLAGEPMRVERIGDESSAVIARAFYPSAAMPGGGFLLITHAA